MSRQRRRPLRVEGHRIRWFVRIDHPTPEGGVRSEWIPRTASMRGLWFYDVRCSCGWESRTGGGTETAVRREAQNHLWDVASPSEFKAWCDALAAR